MTWKEAKNAMIEKGEKITHHYFSDNEYMHLTPQGICFEDGVKVDMDLFWRDRKDEIWQHSWSIFK